MLDAHNHLQFEAFDDDLEAVLEAAIASGVRGAIIADYDAERRERAARLAARPGLWATAGLHPWALEDRDEAWLDTQLEQLERDLEKGDWCGLGELGLDWIRAKSETDRALQRLAFCRQLALAQARDLPIVIHAVKAHEDVLRVLEQEGVPAAGGIIHSFSGSYEQAERYLALGLDLSIGTSVTRRNADRLRAVVERVPMDCILVETDAPSRPPHGVDATRNEPAFLNCVVEAIARSVGASSEEIAKVTEANARRRFRLGDEVLRRLPHVE